MGLTQSIPDTTRKTYTHNDIKDNVQKLFSNNRKNNLSEASGSIKNLDNVQVSVVEFNKPLNGGHMKFNSSKNRHLNHDINEFLEGLQKGGNNMEPISDLSELQKIKDFLLDMDNGSQAGGGILSTEMSACSPQLTLFGALQKISMNGGADDEESSSLDFDDNDSEEKKDDIDDADDDDDDEDVDDDVVDGDEDISSTSDKPINENEKFSETSYSSNKPNDSSELNILPFYSSSDTENFKHPYNKNRFG